MDDSDLSFASILLGFRKTGDPSQVDLGNAKNMMDDKDSIKYAGNSLYEDRPAIPHMTSSQRPETHHVITARNRDAFMNRDHMNSSLEDDDNSQNSQASQRRLLYARNFTDQQLQKLARGRYKCSRCGALKTNHDCAMVEQLEGSSSTQVEKVFLTPDEFYGTPSMSKMFCFSSSATSHDGIRGRPSLGVRIVTVRRQTPSFSFHSPPLSSKMKSIPDYASLCTTTNDNDDDDSTSSNSDRSMYNIKTNNNNNNNNINNNINLSINHHIKKDLKNKMINENIENYYIINPDTTSFPKKRVKYESL